ncbi:MAG: Gfo/Idh/MocA family oxidoreductase [Pseudomonadota bacterium]
MTRLAVLGAGAIGRRHLAHIAEHPELSLAAIIDPDPASATLADAPWVPTFDAFDGELDGVVIATPTQFHEALFDQAAERGWHALIEKPIASDVAGASRMIATAEARGVHILTGHHRRFHPRVTALKSALPRIGQPVLANVMWSVQKPADYFDLAWRQGPEGAPVRMNVSHELDLLQFLFGEVADVAGLGANAVRQTARVESGGVVLRFVSGVIATIAFADCAASPWGFEHGTGENPNIAQTGETSMTITGTDGAIAFPALTLFHGARDWGAVPNAVQVPHGDGVPLVLQLEHFARVIAGQEQPLNDGTAGRRTLELTLEAERLTAT